MLSDKHAEKRPKIFSQDPPSEACYWCRFFFPTPKENTGDCRRNPPNGRYEGFPTANPNDWCGEFKRDEHKIVEQAHVSALQHAEKISESKTEAQEK